MHLHPDETVLLYRPVQSFLETSPQFRIGFRLLEQLIEGRFELEQPQFGAGDKVQQRVILRQARVKNRGHNSGVVIQQPGIGGKVIGGSTIAFRCHFVQFGRTTEDPGQLVHQGLDHSHVAEVVAELSGGSPGFGWFLIGNVASAVKKLPGKELRLQNGFIGGIGMAMVVKKRESG